MNNTLKNDQPIKQVVQYFLRLGLLGFGGPVALVGQMERELVSERFIMFCIATYFFSALCTFISEVFSR